MNLAATIKKKDLNVEEQMVSTAAWFKQDAGRNRKLIAVQEICS